MAYEYNFWLYIVAVTCCKFLNTVHKLTTMLSEFSCGWQRVTPSPSIFHATSFKKPVKPVAVDIFVPLSTNKMAAVGGVSSEVEEETHELPKETGRLDEEQRFKLIHFYKNSPVLWDTSLKLTRKALQDQKNEAINKMEEEFDLRYTSAESVAVWKSLRASMLREVKRENNPGDYHSQWKFYKPLLFLKPSLDLLNNKAEWSDEERRTVANFYQEHPSLWNHKLRDYHDKPRRQVLFQQLEEELEGKYSEKEIVSMCNNMKTYFERDRLREEYKPSGSGTSQVLLARIEVLFIFWLFPRRHVNDVQL